jgi:hypothetical protein
MRTPDEHNDDLESQVVDATETETGIETDAFLDTDQVDEKGAEQKELLPTQPVERAPEEQSTDPRK